MCTFEMETVGNEKKGEPFHASGIIYKRETLNEFFERLALHFLARRHIACLQHDFNSTQACTCSMLYNN